MEQIFEFPDLNVLLLRMKKWQKRTITSFLLLSVSLILFSQKYSLSVPFELSNFRIEKADSFASIQCIENKDISYPMPVGDPKLPYIPFYVLIPHNSSITGILIKEGNFQAMEGNYRISPKTMEESESDSGHIAFPESFAISNPDKTGHYFPSDDQSTVYDLPQLYAGFLIDRVFICPFRYNEKKHQLLFSQKIDIIITYQITDKPLKFETSPEKIEQSREFIREMVINRGEINKIFPLEEKIDYSRIPVFREAEGNSIKAKKVTTPADKQEKSAEPFYIKHIKSE